MDQEMEIYPMPMLSTLAVGDLEASVGRYSEKLGFEDGVCTAGVGWRAGVGSPAVAEVCGLAAISG